METFNPFNYTSPFDESTNELALNSPLTKESVFYTGKENSLYHFLSVRNKLNEFKNHFPNLDLEKFQIYTDTINLENNLFFCNPKKLQIIQHNSTTSIDDLFNSFIDNNTNKLVTYLDNFTWFLEGDKSNTIAIHLFAVNKELKEIVCNIGSDIFDCLKITTNINATGGFSINDENGNYKVNPELDNFKKELVIWFENFYYYSDKFDPKLYFSMSNLDVAVDNEFLAEGNYQRTIDWIFDKMEVTTTFKDFINDLKDTSKNLKSYRVNENQYLPFLPNFDPIVNDSLLKAFGINPNVKIEEYLKEYLADDTEDIKKFQLKEKEVNWVYGYNAGFCGLWNALIDTADGFVEIIPSLYNVFTDRAALKIFLQAVSDFFEHISELLGKLEDWELKNASYSVYRYEYTECYAIGVFLSLFIPMPKTAIAEKIGATATNASAKAIKTATKVTAPILKGIKNSTITLLYELGFRVEKTASEWQLVLNDVIITKGSRKKINKRLENIIKITAKKPNFVFNLISKDRLKKLIDYKKGEGLGISRKSQRLLIQSKLYNANIAVAEFKVSFKGKVIKKELKAYSGSTVKELNPSEWVKPADFRSGEKMQDFVEITENGPIRRFQDTESKIFREFEEIHLKKIMKELGAATTDDLKISVELQTILDPCNVCQGQMDKFQKLYNAKIKIYSSGAQDGIILGKMYPKNKVEKPIKK